MTANNRSFFRLDVMMPCSYHIISAENAEKNPLPLTPDTSYIEKYFLEDFATMDQKIIDMVEKIGERSSLLASVLTAINTKVDFMIQTIDEKNLSQAIPQKMVNLSAGGISFSVDHSINLSDKVDLLIQPLKDESPILVRCSIVKIFPEPSSNCPDCSMIALAFDYLSEDDRRKIVFFIQQREIELAHSNLPTTD